MRRILSVFGVFCAAAICSCTGPAAAGAVQHAALPQSAYLMQRQSSFNDAVDPSLSAQCFSLYLPLLQSVASIWSTNYNACLTTASANRTLTEAQAQTQQDNISQAAAEVGAVIRNCTAISDSMGFFDCFATLNHNLFGTVGAIAHNASDDAIKMQHKLDSIEVISEQCTNASENTYIIQTASVYDAIVACLTTGLPGTLPPATDDSTAGT